jgi:hypothetical protein
MGALMSIRTVRSLLPAVFAFATVSPLLTACDQWALFVNSDGVLSITIVSDGDGRDRFRVRALQSDGISRIMDVPSSGSLTFGAFSAGEVELTLLAPAGCRVADPNPRRLMVNADEPVSVAFDVHCSG